MCNSCKKSIALLLCLVSALTSLCGCSIYAKQNAEPMSATGFLLDTVVIITLYDGQDKDTLQGAFELCRDYEEMLSKTIEGSDVWNVNHAGGQPTVVSDHTAELIATALRYSELTDGAFDITVGPISSLWDFKSENPAVPEKAAIDALLPHVDYKGVQLEGNTVTLADPDMQIDLGGIAKGYIADRVADYLKENGVTSAIINLGGNTYALGGKEGGKDWSVGLQDPFGRVQTSIAAVFVKNKSVVTSGIYERCFELDGQFYHHILDPQTGFPVYNDLTSVTILSDKSVDGDALSTSCYVLGLEKGMALIESLDGIEAIFIDADKNFYATDGVGENGIPFQTIS